MKKSELSGNTTAPGAVVFVQPDAKTSLPIGRIVANRYEIRASLGEGGMGAVYRARDKELDEEIALKILLPERLGDPAMLSRFRREVKIARKITHPNVCRVFDLGENEGLLFLTMEFIEGETLRHWLLQGALSAERAFSWLEQIARGLAAAHDKGVIHRDLKPENILVRAGHDNRDDQIVVADFGLAREPEKDSKRTTANTAGTPAYMSPEQLRGEELDVRSDVFALGIVGFELFCGRSPFGSGSRGEVTVSILRRPPEALGPIPGLSEAVQQSLALLFERALAKDKRQRFASASVFCEALSKARVGLPPPLQAPSSALPPPSAPQPKPWQRRRFFVIFGVLLGGSALWGANTLRTKLPEHLQEASLPSAQTRLPAPPEAAKDNEEACIRILAAQNLSGDATWDGLSKSLPESLAGGLRTIKGLKILMPEDKEDGTALTWSLQGSLQKRGQSIVLGAQFISDQPALAGEPIEIGIASAEANNAPAQIREAALNEAKLLMRQFERRKRAKLGSTQETARAKLLQYIEMSGPAPRREQISSGMKLLDEALEKDPAYVPALVERSLLASMGPGNAEQRLQNALGDLDRATSVAPNDSSVLVMRCRILQVSTAAAQKPSDASIQKAFDACHAAQQSEANSAYVLIALARLNDLICQDNEAIALLSRSLELDQSLAGRALSHLLVLTLKHGQAHLAERLSEQLITLFEEEQKLGDKARTRRAGAPPTRNAYFMRGAALLHVGKAVQAQEAFERELSFLSPERPDKVMEAAALLGMRRAAQAQKKALPEIIAQRARRIEQEWQAQLERKSEEAMALLDAYSFIAPEVGIPWLRRMPKPSNCRDAVGMALLAAQASRPDLAKEMLSGCTPSEEWERSCIAGALSLGEHIK